MRQKIDNHFKKGNFLGYTSTSSQIYYWDMNTNITKTPKHLQFDEGINDIEIPTPNYRQMRISFVRSLTENQEEAPIIMPPTLEYQQTQFPIIHDVPVGVTGYHGNLKMIIVSCPDIDMVYFKCIITRKYFPKIKGVKNRLRGACIVQIRNAPVVTLSDAEETMSTSMELVQ